MAGIVRRFSQMTHAEWICFIWVNVTTVSDSEPKYLRSHPRALDEAMKLAGGSIEKLKPYLWVLDASQYQAYLAKQEQP